MRVSLSFMSMTHPLSPGMAARWLAFHSPLSQGPSHLPRWALTLLSDCSLGALAVGKESGLWSGRGSRQGGSREAQGWERWVGASLRGCQSNYTNNFHS